MDPVGADDANRKVIEQYIQALQRHDIGTVRALRTEDFTVEWPQSGERVVGRDNARAVEDAYPGLPDVETLHLNGHGPFWLREGRLTYEDQTTFFADVLEVRDGRIARSRDYFAAPFEAPAWRAQWVERAPPA